MNDIDRRHERRFATDFPSWITTSEGNRLKAVTTNISASGLELTGDHKLMTSLYPNFKREDYRQPLEICVEFNVPVTTNQEAPVWLYCQLIYCRRTQADCFNIGCQFTEIDSITEKNLSVYLQNLSEKVVCASN